MRRPFNFDLVYPYPELRPVIGKVKTSKEQSALKNQVNTKPKKDK